MKGLIVKDFRLLLQRKKFFLIMAIWAIAMTFILDDPEFVVGWLIILMSIFSLSSLSYDEYDNSMPFLMSMPVSPKDYAIEKYIFGLLCGLTGWLYAVILIIVSSLIKSVPVNLNEILLSSASYIPIAMFIIAFNLPIELKWGSDKGRTYMLLIYGIGFLIVMAVSKLIPGSTDIGTYLNSIDSLAFSIAAIAAVIIAFIVSVLLSIRIMNKKEY